MNILVTGADGLLGSNLVRLLLERGDTVRVFVHPASRSNTLDGLSVERVTGDILEPAQINRAAADCEAVFHCAASTATWPPRDPKITAINVQGTMNVLDACAEAGVRRLVHVSTSSTFGFGTKRNPGTEKTRYKYKLYGMAYMDSKLEGQKRVLERTARGDVDAVIVNPTFMFGPYDSGPSSGRMIVTMATRRIPFYPPGGKCAVHVRDVAGAMIAALEKGRTGECYLLGNRNMDYRELFGLFEDVLGFPAPKIPLPYGIMLAAGAVGSAIADATKKPQDITWGIALGACTGAYYDSAKARRELGLGQTPIEVAVKEAYDWLKDNGNIV